MAKSESSSDGLPWRAGYRHQMRQPSVTISVRLVCPPLLNFKAIDDWLKHSFDIDIAMQPAPDWRGNRWTHAIVSGLMWRIMHLGAELLRAVKIPTFDTGRILDIKPEKGEASTWHVMIAVPCLDHVHQSKVIIAYEQAAMAVRWLTGRARTPGNAQTLFAHLQKSFIDPVKKTIPGGDSTIPMLRAAWLKNIPFRHLGFGVYQLGWGRPSLRVDRGAIGPDSAIGAKMAQNKWIAANLIRDAGLPAPTNRLVASMEEALSAARFLGWPVVIKPVNRDRGEGVTVAVSSDFQLDVAFRTAASLAREVIVEREVAGICHRVLVAHDQVHIVSKRMAKSVRGDGQQTVAQLVCLANDTEIAKPPWLRLKSFPLDDLALQCLAVVGMAPGVVPADGEFVPLRPIQSTEDGGVVEDMTEEIHADNVTIAVKASRLFGLSLAGVDIISPDIRRPWYENGAIINEVNFCSLLPDNLSGSVLPALLGQFVAKDGRIPVEVVIGGEAGLDVGNEIRTAYVDRGYRCFLTSHTTTVSPEGECIPLSSEGLFGRCIALAMDSEVEAIVMVVQTDELLHTGLPFDRVDSVTLTDGATNSAPALPADLKSQAWIEATLRLLKPYNLRNQSPMSDATPSSAD